MARSAAYAARNKAIREAMTNRDQARAASIPTAKVVPAEAKKLGVKWEVEDVADGARIHWVGDRSLKKVILYIHGEYFPTRHPSIATCIKRKY